MWEAEPFQSSMPESQGMSENMSNTPAAQTCAQDTQREGSHCAKLRGEQLEL